MNANIAIANLNVSLECGLLRRIEDVSSRHQKDHGPLLRQGRIVEKSRLFGGCDLEIILDRELLDGENSVGNGSMAEAGGSREDENAGID